MPQIKRAAAFAAVLAALNVAHEIGDHWVQTNHQAATKGGRGEHQRAGQLACAGHVAGVTAAKAVVLAITCKAIGLRLRPGRTAAALVLDAGTHYWADRRWTLEALAELLGKGAYFRLGLPREGRDDPKTLGSGRFALDQAFHRAALWATALIISGGAE
ncbi:transcriptional regulator [Nonomuraea turkmeniaca]|uniref:Transcriptional regulator n=2 Tax=Nonomuraea turkmeniaca TaxID=103838 RepID=A0A5S4EYS6_9ACTN|nr:transcriptional regulator [Nonomuraea turkmeniaca]